MGKLRKPVIRPSFVASSLRLPITATLIALVFALSPSLTHAAAPDSITISAGNALTFVGSIDNNIVTVSFLGVSYTINDSVDVINVTNNGAAVVVGSGTNTVTISGINSLSFDTGAGVDTFNIRSVNDSTSVTNTTSTSVQTVVIGGAANGAQGIAASVNVNNTAPGGAGTDLILDDANDVVSRSPIIINGLVTGLAPAAISHGIFALNSIEIRGGSAGNTFTVAFNANLSGRVIVTTINSGNGADTVNVQVTAGNGGANIVIQGQNGADTVNIGNVNGMTAITGAVSVDNTNGSTNLTLNDAGDSGARNATISNVSVTGLAPASITYTAHVIALLVLGGPFNDTFTASAAGSGPANITVNGNDGNDTFNVTPSATTVFRINGNAPVTTPGDALNVNTAGATGTLLTRSNPGGQTHDGNYAFTNRQTIFFTSIETLSPITTPTAANGTVSGRILDQDGHPVEGVGIWMSGTQNRLTVTDANGFYHFENVQENGLYVLTPARLNYSFSPQIRQFSQLGQHTDAVFSAVYNGESNNPLDRAEYFVRQQYIDLLGREPDEAGFTSWVNGINNCAPDDASCDRIHVSEMFFRSSEFQARGYYLYRFYSTAFGRKPDFAEFGPDLQRVSGFLTDEQVEAAKATFANDFVARPFFVSAYGGLGNADYVDAILRSAQVRLSNRDELVASLNSGTLTRAQVLRQIVESNEVYQKYYNQAFVVMEYFGYLRRDPDALYTDWIDVLNQSGNARHMVEGFVDSSEYRNRFTR